jgi:hypothetical protein
MPFAVLLRSVNDIERNGHVLLSHSKEAANRNQAARASEGKPPRRHLEAKAEVDLARAGDIDRSVAITRERVTGWRERKTMAGLRKANLSPIRQASGGGSS